MGPRMFSKAQNSGFVRDQYNRQRTRNSFGKGSRGWGWSQNLSSSEKTREVASRMATASRMAAATRTQSEYNESFREGFFISYVQYLRQTSYLRESMVSRPRSIGIHREHTRAVKVCGKRRRIIRGGFRHRLCCKSAVCQRISVSARRPPYAPLKIRSPKVSLNVPMEFTI